MATSTPNLGLINPADGELFDVETLRQNNNTLDTFAGTVKAECKIMSFADAAETWTAGVGSYAGALVDTTATQAANGITVSGSNFAVQGPGAVSGSIKILEAGLYQASWFIGASFVPGLGSFYIQYIRGVTATDNGMSDMPGAVSNLDFLAYTNRSTGANVDNALEVSTRPFRIPASANGIGIRFGGKISNTGSLTHDVLLTQLRKY